MRGVGIRVMSNCRRTISGASSLETVTKDGPLMVRLLKSVAVIVLVVTLAGCASTSIRDSWTAPDIQGPLDYQKILVVFIDPTLFRSCAPPRTRW